jgi:hypothetical protein
LFFEFFDRQQKKEKKAFFQKNFIVLLPYNGSSKAKTSNKEFRNENFTEIFAFEGVFKLKAVVPKLTVRATIKNPFNNNSCRTCI